MERIGAYVIERTLGEGGMGTVYLARSPGGRAVAVKVARPELAAGAGFRERFRAEAAAAREVGGLHTVPVVDAGPDAEAPWLATAYVPGPTLSGLLTTHGPMDDERLRSLGAALAEALRAIHECGLVHRDLKPSNIIIAEDGPRVLDFGIARAVENTRITVTGTAFGTPGFLAPEQVGGRTVDGAADVFALGAVLVAAAGGSAFGSGAPVRLIHRTVYQEADLSAVPDALRPLVSRCLYKDPRRRPTIGRLLDAFTAQECREPAARPPDTSSARPARPTGQSCASTVMARSGTSAVTGLPSAAEAGSADDARESARAGGMMALSPTSRAVLAIAAAVAAVAVVVHIGMIFLHLAPSNTVSEQYDSAIDTYVFPEYEQNWKLFAPNPLQQNVAVHARAEVRTRDGASERTDWLSLTAIDTGRIRGNLLPSHVAQNELRRAWSFFTSSHDDDDQPTGPRGELSEQYLRRIVMMRLGTGTGRIGDGRIQRIQVRSVTDPVPSPPWSGETDDTGTQYRQLPWWTVTDADIPGSK